jgi:putative FmdB family regulatory protein
MPRYNYTCESCTNQFEARYTYAEIDTARPACPECGSEDCTRGLNRVNMTASGTSGSSASSASGCGSCSRVGGCSGCSH